MKTSVELDPYMLDEMSMDILLTRYFQGKTECQNMCMRNVRGDLTLQVLEWEVPIVSTEQPGWRSGLIEKAKVAKNQVREKAKANIECFIDMSKTEMRRKLPESFT